MKRLYKLKWSEGDNKWHLLNPFDNDAFVMDLPDCGNWRTQADQPDKDKVDLFVVDVHRFNDTQQPYETERP